MFNFIRQLLQFFPLPPEPQKPRAASCANRPRARWPQRSSWMVASFHGFPWSFKMTRNQWNENGIQLDGKDVCIKYGGCPKGRKVIPAASGPPHRLRLHCLGEPTFVSAAWHQRGQKPRTAALRQLRFTLGFLGSHLYSSLHMFKAESNSTSAQQRLKVQFLHSIPKWSDQLTQSYQSWCHPGGSWPPGPACISSSATSWFFSSLRQNCTALRSLASTKTCEEWMPKKCWTSGFQQATRILQRIHTHIHIYIYSNTIHTYLYIYRQQSGLHFKPAPRPASGFTCSVFTSAVMPETPPAAIVLIRVVFPAPLRPTCGHWAGSGAKL